VNRFVWTEQGKAELRQIDREQAMRILLELTRYEATGQGDVRKLKGSDEFRLRVGDYRVRFDVLEDGRLNILHVFHRKEAYRE
jgi:mRNA-degrading endonuclease RelE of RelBE toxin-antitoxin system